MFNILTTHRLVLKTRDFFVIYMNFLVIIFALFLIVRVKFTKCQRLTHTEMLEILDLGAHLTPNVNPENLKCFLAINGSYYPQVPYVFAVCETSIYYSQVVYDKFIEFYNAHHCSGVDCWESQLTDATKLDIIDILNSYRQSVARGSCGPQCRTNKRRLIFELRWFFIYEADAWEFMTPCSNTSYHPQVFSRQPLTKNILGVFVSTSFKVETGLQSELRAKLLDLLRGNYLYDWDPETGQFRRGLTNEVGCVYSVRRNVPHMITGLGEEVEFADVGYFGCFFRYISERAIEEWGSKELNTTAANCQALDVDRPITVTPDALYPSLCKEVQDLSRVRSPLVTCQLSSSYHGDFFKKVCSGTRLVKNKKTWSEKVSGLLMRYVFRKDETGEHHDFYNAACNLPDPPDGNHVPNNNRTTNTTNLPCTSAHEVNVTTTTSLCPGWSYWDSQLTNGTRQRILNSLNEARQFVAQGKCENICRPPCNCDKKTEYCNVVELRWHWYLESVAAKKVRNCPTEYATKEVNYPKSPFLDSSFFEEVTVVFDLPPEMQTKLPEQMVKLFWTNGLNDWKNDGTFRRGNAAWIGCAIIIRIGKQIDTMRQEYRRDNGTATHMVCVFVSLDEDFISKPDKVTKQCCPTCTQGTSSGSNRCLLQTTKGVLPFPFLCSSVLFSEKTTLNCGVRNVTFQSPHTIVLQTTTESPSPSESQLLKMEHEQKKIYSRKICKIIIFLYLVELSVLLLVLALLYRYSVENKLYSKS